MANMRKNAKDNIETEQRKISQYQAIIEREELKAVAVAKEARDLQKQAETLDFRRRLLQCWRMRPSWRKRLSGA